MKMIKNKTEYKYYLEADRIALDITSRLSIAEKIASIFSPDYIWQFTQLLRKMEYIHNSKKHLSGLRYLLAWRRFNDFSIKLGFSVPINTCGPGLNIAHTGHVVISPYSTIGENCKLFPGVVIGVKLPKKGPHIGNNVYIGAGVKIIGEIEIADDIAIGANSVVNRSFTESGITIAGVPARKISNKGSLGLLTRATEILGNRIPHG
jgi:serine O-acetyltransferase